MKNWIISSQVPKLVMIEHGKGSESRCLWVSNDGLTNQMRLKVYSGLIRNCKDIRPTKPYNADEIFVMITGHKKD